MMHTAQTVSLTTGKKRKKMSAVPRDDESAEEAPHVSPAAKARLADSGDGDVEMRSAEAHATPAAAAAAASSAAAPVIPTQQSTPPTARKKHKLSPALRADEPAEEQSHASQAAKGRQPDSHHGDVEMSDGEAQAATPTEAAAAAAKASTSNSSSTSSRKRTFSNAEGGEETKEENASSKEKQRRQGAPTVEYVPDAYQKNAVITDEDKDVSEVRLSAAARRVESSLNRTQVAHSISFIFSRSFLPLDACCCSRGAQTGS